MAEREHSAGFVVWRRGRRGAEFLLVHSSEHSYWGFPKGLVEEGEDDLAAARRELEEETGLTRIRVDPDFRTSDEYSYDRAGVRFHKTVTYFLAEVLSGRTRLSEEHDDCAWLTFDAALEAVSYEGARRILRAARARLEFEGVVFPRAAPPR